MTHLIKHIISLEIRHIGMILSYSIITITAAIITADKLAFGM